MQPTADGGLSSSQQKDHGNSNSIGLSKAKSRCAQNVKQFRASGDNNYLLEPEEFTRR